MDAQSPISQPIRIIDGYPATRQYANAEDAESENMVMINGKAVAFGYRNAHWRALIRTMQEGDELWHSISGLDENGLSGYEGMLLVRGDKVVDSLLLAVGVQ